MAIRMAKQTGDASEWVTYRQCGQSMMYDVRTVSGEYVARYCDDTRDGFFLHESHVGLVLYTGERNYRDDSDFYAIVWNPATQKPETIEYATTRGWTYANSAKVDATPEVVAAYAAWQKAERALAEAAAAAREALEPRVGKVVRVVGGRGPNGFVGTWVGTVAVVYWRGANQFRTYYKNGFNDPSDKHNQRLGLKLPCGWKCFTALTNVEVITDAAEADRAMALQVSGDSRARPVSRQAHA